AWPAALEHPLDEPPRRHLGQFGAAYLVEERLETASPEDLQALERSQLRGEILGCDRAVSQSAHQGAGAVLRREEPVPGSRTYPVGSAAGAEATAHDDARLCPSWHGDVVRRAQPVDREADNPHRGEPHPCGMA